MRVIDCDCGATLQAANDDDLFQQTRKHVDEQHSDMEMSDDQVKSLIADQAYDATDS